MLKYTFLKTLILFAIVIVLNAGCRFPEIVSPNGDITIDAGESLSFEAESYPNAIYKWTFDGAATDRYGQNATVQFDAAGVYDVFLTVIFEDLESGFASINVTVNDSPPVSYTISLDNYTATRDRVDSEILAWIIEKDGNIVIRRNAKNESEFTYFDNSTGIYQIWLERFHNGAYLIASNKVGYSVP